MRHYDQLHESDPDLANALADEFARQQETLTLIASENHASQSVLTAQGSVLTNKYAEGYPDERYYAGCEYADEGEQLAISRAKDLWRAEHANVQPHSGTQANMGVYFAVLNRGDKILSLELSDGGHLTHGHTASFSGQLYEVEHYHVDPETGYIDYEALDEQAREFQPDLIVSGYSAYPREVEFDRVQAAADAVGAYHLADIAHTTGLVAAGVHTSPVGIADFVTGSTHKTIRAGRGGIIMCRDEYADAIDNAVFPGAQGGPLLHNIAGKAAGFEEALQPSFHKYAEQIVANAQSLADRLQDRGLSVVSGGTDTHLLLVDLRDSHPDVTGQEAEQALADAGIVLNKNTVPGETRSPTTASGLRFGTSALTSRGFNEAAMRQVADLSIRTIDHLGDYTVRDEVAGEVQTLCEDHPVYVDRCI
jgi:glycine hydroxymethyltransferase